MKKYLKFIAAILLLPLLLSCEKENSDEQTTDDPNNNNNSGVVGDKSVTVTDPNGYDDWFMGDYEYIKWESAGFESNVKIELYKKNSSYKVIAEDVENNHSYKWSIPGNLDVYDKYKIRVSSVEFPDVYGMSDDYFEIDKEPFIEVTKPKASDGWGNDTYKYIEWDSYNAGDDVKIELYFKASNGYESKETTITFSTENDGSYHWRVETDYIGISCYRIKVISNKSSSIYDYSPYFSITF